MMKLLPQPPAFFPEEKSLLQNQNVLTMKNEELRHLRGNRIRMIFQDPMSSLNPFLKIETQLMEVLMIHKKQSRDEAWKNAVEMLERVVFTNPTNVSSNILINFPGGCGNV
ncbi:MAG: hypothetical protein R2877_00870 [Bdellovibrionota bacterium]